MAARLLSVALGTAALVAAACQVGPIAIVECRTTADCPAGETCSPSHACVGPEAPPMMEPMSPEGGSGNAGTPDGGTPDSGTPGEGTPLAWGADAHLPPNNPFGIRGSWFRADDCESVAIASAEARFVCPPAPPTPGCCTLWDAALTGPAPDRSPGLAITAGTLGDGRSRICIKGTVTQILNDPNAMPAFAIQWGAILSMQLDEGSPYDTTVPFPGGKLIGFSVDLEGPPTTQPLRVGFHTDTNNTYFVELQVPAQGAKILFADAKLGEWVMPQVPLEPTQVADLSFNIPSYPDATTPVDFCVTNVRVLQESDTPSGD